MALARVQSTPKATSQLAAAATFATPPTLGNGIVVGVQISGNPTTSCADNQGNVYTLAKVQAGTSESVRIYYCPAITATGSPFTVTVTSPVNAAMVAVAVEVGGVGSGLAVDVSAGGGGTSSSPNVLSGSVSTTNLYALVVLAFSATQGSITVSTTDGLSPGWTQEAEELSYGPWQSGELDSRVLTAASGGLQVTWTGTAAGTWAVALAAFKATPLTEGRVSQLAVETLSLPVPSARVSQAVVEVLGGTVSATAADARVSQLTVETLQPTPPTVASVSQLSVETLTAISSPSYLTQEALEVFRAEPARARTTQLATEVFQQQSSRVRTTQAAVEVFLPLTIPTRTTQAAVEFFNAAAARTDTTQIAVEIFRTLVPCVQGEMPWEEAVWE